MEIYDVIVKSLIDEGYDKKDIIDYTNAEYFVTYNPIVSDDKTMSCMIFKETGVMKLLNGSVEIDGISYTTLTLTSWLRKLTKAKLKHYIQYIYYQNDIDRRTIPEYIEYIKNKLLNIPQRYSKKYEDLRKLLYTNYILDVDMLQVNCSTDMIVYELAPQDKPDKISAKTEFIQPTSNEIDIIDQYLTSRGLSKLSIKKSGSNVDDILYTTVVTNDIYRKPAIGFKYMCDYTKYRICFEQQKKYRFRSSGKYENFFKVRQNYTDTLYIVEGEIEGLTIAQYIDDDILCIHNTNSFPSDYSEIKKYKNVIIKIDYDRFEDNKKAFSKYGANIITDYKIQDNTEDYNSLHTSNKLTKQIIQKINTKGSD